MLLDANFYLYPKSQSTFLLEIDLEMVHIQRSKHKN